MQKGKKPVRLTGGKRAAKRIPLELDLDAAADVAGGYVTGRELSEKQQRKLDKLVTAFRKRSRR